MRICSFRDLTLLLLASGLVLSAGAQAVGKSTLGKTTLKGTSLLNGGGQPVYTAISLNLGPPEHDLGQARAGSVGRTPAAKKQPGNGLSIPAPPVDSIKNKGGVSLAFAGLTTVDTANTNGYVTSPPDQGLCAGNGYVMEAINSVLAVYDTAGNPVTVPESVYPFFQTAPAPNFLADPRCYYDSATQRWFVSMTNVLNGITGRSNLALAVSKTSNPAGEYYVYSIDTTEDGFDGTPSNPSCSTALPCFGDQPLLGADAYGVFLTTNEFGVFSNTFNGAQIYAMSKKVLEAGLGGPLVHIGGIPLAEGIAYSVQPASSPDLSGEAAPGVEYFLSALDFQNTLDNRIAVWALTNTQSLDSTPNVALLNTVIGSEVYGFPPLATQKAGPYPLGQALGEPEETLDTDDDRMQNAVYASNHLWAGLTTVISDGANINAGIAYFDVMPSVKGGVLSAKLQGQSYISAKGNSVIYPGIGVSADGTVAAAFTLSGPSYYPSAAWAHLTPAHTTGINIAQLGQAPQDDFSGYPEFGGFGAARWGDYSWGVADGGSLWLATEYIPGDIDSLYYLTNFGTYIEKVDLQ